MFLPKFLSEILRAMNIMVELNQISPRLFSKSFEFGLDTIMDKPKPCHEKCRDADCVIDLPGSSTARRVE